MAAYLVENPPRRSQYRKPRRSKPTGTVVLHTAENAPDLVPPDLGAENIARFIRNRTDPGSYHTINDQDSRIRLVPFEWEAFGDGTGSNPWAIQLSIAMTAEQWWKITNQQKLWYMAGLASAAREASDWLQAKHGITVPARRLTKASAREAGFCSHQDRETWFGTPGRRTDPWRNDDALWHLFLTLYEDATRTPLQEELDDMEPEAFVVIAYRTIFDRLPESVAVIGEQAKRVKSLGQAAFLGYLRGTPEGVKRWGPQA
jgi:hypothetical protein